MNACDQCAKAWPITTCPDSINVGTVDEVFTTIRVRFTDLATTRETIAEVDTDQLPVVVAVDVPAFAPGNMVMVEVLLVLPDASLGAPLPFLPWQQADETVVEATDEVQCLTFTPVKTFTNSGAFVNSDPYLIIQ
jgi:hypothetical protein